MRHLEFLAFLPLVDTVHEESDHVDDSEVDKNYM